MKINDVLLEHILTLDMADVYEEEALLYLDVDLVTAFDHYRRAQELRRRADAVLDTEVEYHDRTAPARFLITQEDAEEAGGLYISSLLDLISHSAGTITVP